MYFSDHVLCSTQRISHTLLSVQPIKTRMDINSGLFKLHVSYVNKSWFRVGKCRVSCFFKMFNKKIPIKYQGLKHKIKYHENSTEIDRRSYCHYISARRLQKRIGVSDKRSYFFSKISFDTYLIQNVSAVDLARFTGITVRMHGNRYRLNIKQLE